MKTVYVYKKSELTSQMDAWAADGFRCYRTRSTTCGCRFPANRRDGVIAVKDDIVTFSGIRCKACAAKQDGKEAEDGR